MNVMAIIKALSEAFELLEAATVRVEVSLRQERDFKAMLPEYPGHPDARELAIDHLTRLWFRDEAPLEISSGLLCASTDSVAAIEALNAAKANFKTTVVDLREQVGDSKSKSARILRRLFDQESQRADDENDEPLRQEWNELEIAFKRLRWQRLDLLRCYAKVRILEPNTESVSWTWAAVHSAQRVVSYQEAVAQAEALEGGSRQIALKQLSALPAQTDLIYFKRLLPQLRANVVWHENGQRLRKAITVSGILICQSTHLPRYVWRSKPILEDGAPPTRLKRSDAMLDTKPVVPLLHLYLHRVE